MNPPPAPTIVPNAPTANPIATRSAATPGEKATAPARGLRARAAQDVDDALFRGVAIARAELLLENLRQLARLGELLHNVGAADELALDEHLRDRRPAREVREFLPDRGVGKDVHRGDGRARLAERAERAVRVAAHDELRRAL